jgi:uncharacterized protein (DUF2267 family)
MSHTETGIDAVERTIQKTNEWIKEVESGLGWEDRHFAFQAIRAVLHILRDRLPLPVAIHLGDQLPVLIRGVYYENWSPTREHVVAGNAQDFATLLQLAFPKEYNLDAARMAQSVFRVLRAHVSEGEFRILRGNLPASIAAMLE